VHLSGFLGWVVWLFIHIGFLTGFRNRLGALLSWWPAFVRDVRRERTYTTEQVGLVHSAYGVLPTPAPGTALPGSTTGAEPPSAGTKPSATGTGPSSRAG
jgi:NADH:quinone reductase (non-electrogenic)